MFAVIHQSRLIHIQCYTLKVSSIVYNDYIHLDTAPVHSVKLLQNMVFNTPPPPPHSHKCIFCAKCTFSLGRGGEVSWEKAALYKYSIVPSSMGATVHKLVRKYQPWVNVSPVYKSVKHTAAKSG